MDSQADTRRAVDQGSDLSDDEGDSTKRRLSDLDESRALGEHWGQDIYLHASAQTLADGYRRANPRGRSTD